MTVSPVASTSKIQTALTNLGIPEGFIAYDTVPLLQQLVVALGNVTPGGGSTEWGDITGTLSNQTDLQNALNEKANVSSLSINVKDYGALGDSRQMTDGVLNGTTTVTSATAAFTDADIGKEIWGVEASSGIARLTLRTIASVTNSTTVVVSGTSVGIGSYTGIYLVVGTDDSDAIIAAFADAFAQVPPLSVKVPGGGYTVSKLLFNQVGGSSGKGVHVHGDGSESTKIFVAPNYSLATTTVGTGMIWRADGNARFAGLMGITIDGSYFDFGASGYHVVSDGGAADTFEDVRIQKFKGVTTGLAFSGIFSRSIALRVEALNFNGISVNGGSGVFTDCYSGNHGNYSLAITNISGAANGGARVIWENGTVDESTAGSLDVATASTDVVFSNAILFGSLSHYAAKIRTGCVVRFDGCQIIPFGTGNRGGLQVDSGGVAYLSICRLGGSGTLYAIDNAGTVVDGGANVAPTTTGAGATYALSLNAYKAPATAGYPQFAAEGRVTGMRAYDDGTSSRRCDFWLNGAVAASLQDTGLTLDQIPLSGVGKTITAAATTGAQTINRQAGSVNFAAGATSLVVTNNQVTVNTVVIPSIGTNDATAAGLKVVVAPGSFTLYLGVAPTAETRVNFWVIN